MSDIAPTNRHQVAYDGTAQLREIITRDRELSLKYTSPNPFYLKTRILKTCIRSELLEEYVAQVKQFFQKRPTDSHCD